MMQNAFLLAESEFRRQLGLLKVRYIREGVTQIVYVLSFLLLSGLSNIVANGHFNEQQQLSFLVGYVTWWVASSCVRQIPQTIAEDARWGTLEQIRIRGASLWGMLFARSITIATYYSLHGLLMVGLIALTAHLEIPLLPILVIPYLLTLIGAFGMGFIFVGTQIIYKNTATLSDAASFLLFFMGGALFSYQAGSTSYIISRFFPLASGVDVMRFLVIGIPVREEWILLGSNAAVYFLLGIAILNWSFRRAQLDGSLAHY